jgi:hypothetical protein
LAGRRFVAAPFRLSPRVNRTVRTTVAMGSPARRGRLGGGSGATGGDERGVPLCDRAVDRRVVPRLARRRGRSRCRGPVAVGRDICCEQSRNIGRSMIRRRSVRRLSDGKSASPGVVPATAPGRRRLCRIEAGVLTLGFATRRRPVGRCGRTGRSGVVGRRHVQVWSGTKRESAAARDSAAIRSRPVPGVAERRRRRRCDAPAGRAADGNLGMRATARPARKEPDQGIPTRGSTKRR